MKQYTISDSITPIDNISIQLGGVVSVIDTVYLKDAINLFEYIPMFITKLSTSMKAYQRYASTLHISIISNAVVAGLVGLPPPVNTHLFEIIHQQQVRP